MDRKTALIYAKMPEHKYLVNKTMIFVRWALRQVERPYVACSFGKDSAVMLHMILQYNPQIPIRFIRWQNETEHIDNYDETIAKWGSINLQQIVLCRESLSDKRAERYYTTGYDSYFIGLRQSESTGRRITLKKDGKFYKSKTGIVRISPLSIWKDADVAAYVFSNNLPILNSYLADGITTRTASRIPRSDYGIRESFVAKLKHRDFQAYQKLIITFPELRNYT